MNIFPHAANGDEGRYGSCPTDKS
uniref:Uncharacterized protein n=1 Tax=Tetraselmis sp. GSL018 TaxID=582737 RepID=A0A061R4G6_9CHLO